MDSVFRCLILLNECEKALLMGMNVEVCRHGFSAFWFDVIE